MHVWGEFAKGLVVSGTVQISLLDLLGLFATII